MDMSKLPPLPADWYDDLNDLDAQRTVAELIADLDVGSDDPQPSSAKSSAPKDWRPYTVAQAAEATGLARYRLYRMIRDLQIKAWPTPAGRLMWLIDASEVERLKRVAPDT